MNCEQANLIDLVEYLHTLGHDSKKIRGEDHWYVSPLRQEKEASFKVNKNKNVWFDFGLGKGGNLVDFATEYFRCSLSEALQKISFSHQQNNHQNIAARPPVHPNKNSLFDEAVSGETAIKIIAAKKPIYDPMLCRYLRQRRIQKSIADKYCYEVLFKNNNGQNYKAIGFKNNAGGYELRNEYFKGSSSPKYVSYLNNSANKITVFEGFFGALG